MKTTTKLIFIFSVLVSLSSFAEVREFLGCCTKFTQSEQTVFVEITDSASMQVVYKSADAKCGFLPYTNSKELSAIVWGLNKSELEKCWAEWSSQLTGQTKGKTLHKKLAAHKSFGFSIGSLETGRIHLLTAAYDLDGEPIVGFNGIAVVRIIGPMASLAETNAAHDKLIAYINLAKKAIDPGQHVYLTLEGEDDLSREFRQKTEL